MTAPAPRQPHRNPPAAAPRGSTAPPSLALLTLDPLSPERVLHEAAHHMRQALAAESVAIALAGGDGAGDLRLVAETGLAADERGVGGRLADSWRQAFDSGGVVTQAHADAVELTARIETARAPLGVVTIVFRAGDRGANAAPFEDVIVALAGQLASAIERAAAVHRRERGRRVTAVGEIATGLAHGLKNPLAGISSAAQLLRFRVTEDPVVEKNVGRILRDVERLNALVASLLEFGQPAPLRLTPGDPDVVWDDVLAFQRGRLESRALRVNRVRPSPGARAMIDPGQLSQAFTQLLANAVEAAPEGSDLSLTSDVLPGGGWRMQLANGGSTVPREVLERAFEIFFSTKAEGLGIGLALSRRIVEDHGGTIALRSDDAGTIVSVTLPPPDADPRGEGAD